jgi:hypothetical protein
LTARFAEIIWGKSSIAGSATWSEANHTPHGLLTTETFEECAAGQTVTVVEKAELIIHHEEVEPAQAGTGVLTVKGGKLEKVGGRVPCASPAEWQAEYESTSPNPLWTATKTIGDARLGLRACHSRR